MRRNVELDVDVLGVDLEPQYQDTAVFSTAFHNDAAARSPGPQRGVDANTSSDCTVRSVTFRIERFGKRIVQQSYSDTRVVETMYSFVCFFLKFRAEIVCILDV